MIATATDALSDKVMDVVRDIAKRSGITKPIGEREGLVDCGLNSIAMVDLMLAVEATFDVTIPQRDLTPENFRSVATIEAIIARLTRPAAASR